MSNTRLPKLAQSTQNQPRLSRRKLYAAMLIASQWMAAGQLWAAPEGGEVVGGEGVIEQSGVDTLIHQATERLAIDWQSFDVAANERVEFIQPSSSSIALNRVLSNNGTQILGRIDSNGQVMVVNPNGVVFGKDSIINVGGMIASGMSIDPASFINGDFTLNSLEGTEGKVINYGIINAATGGSVTLVGQQVQNDGLISAKLGAVNLAAGNEAVLTFDQSGLVGVKVTEAVLQNELGVDAAIINSGAINAEGGRVLLSASVSEDIFSNAVNNAGMNKASSVVVHDDGSFTLGAGADVINTGDIDTSVATGAAGQVVVVGNNITSSGTITANTGTGTAGAIELHSTDITLITETGNVSAQAATQGEGGDIKILGNKVGLFDSAEVNASGADGGGQVLIGGDKTGQNQQVRNADFIYLGEDTAVKTNALINGNGGKLITFASDTARIYGNLYSRGGSEGGNGGFIETSGLKGFEILSTPDMGAVTGGGGLWLIDPSDIVISDQGTSPGVGNDSPFTSSANINIRYSRILDALDDGDVTVQTGIGGTTSGSITLSHALDYEGDSAPTLTFLAGNGININNNISSSSGQLNLVFHANSDGTGGGDFKIANDRAISTNGGDVTITGVDFDAYSNRDSFGTINTYGEFGGGDINIDVTGNVDFGATRFDYDYESADGNTAALVRVGSLTVKAGGDVTLNEVRGRLNSTATGQNAFSYYALNFNDTGRRKGNAEAGYSGNVLDAFLNVEAGGNINVRGKIFDSWGDARDSLDVTLKASSGNINIEKDIYTAGGNFTATANNIYSQNALINTDSANDDNNYRTGPSAPVSVDGNWSNGGNITINATTDVSLGSLVTDAVAESGTRQGNLIIQGVNQTDDVSDDDITVDQNGLLNIAGTSTFNIGVGGNITLTDPDNSFTGSLSFVSANNVELFNTDAIVLDDSVIIGLLKLTGNGITQVDGKKLEVGTTTILDGDDEAITLANDANNFGGAVTVTNATDLSLVDTDSLYIAELTVAGNINLTSGDETDESIVLKGNLDNAAGTAKNIILNSNVTLESNVELDAGTGDIRITGTTNSDATLARDLTLIGKDITFTNTVGGGETLGSFTVTSTGDVSFQNINAASLTVAGPTSNSGSVSFFANDIKTAGGNVAITSANSIEFNSIDTSDATAGSITLTANGTGTTKSITVKGDLNANHTGTGQNNVQLTLANTDTAAPGTVSFNSDSFLSSNVEVTGSGSADTLKAPNTNNTWDTTALNSGLVKDADNPTSKTITYIGFENITGGSGVDTFNLSHNITTSVNGGDEDDIFNIDFASLDAAVNGGAGDDVFNINVATTKAFLNGDEGADIFNVVTTDDVTATLTGGDDDDTLVSAATGANSWSLGENDESLDGSLGFSGIENLTGNDYVDTFTFIGTRTSTGIIDAGSGADDDIVSVADNAGIDYRGDSFSFFGVTNAEVLHSSSGNGVLSALSDAADIINWRFDSTTNSVTDGANLVKYTGFTSYIGGAGADNFTVEDNITFAGLIDGGHGNNIFDFSTATEGYSIVLGSAYKDPSSATLSNIGEIKANSHADTSLEAIAEAIAGTNSWEITAKDSGKVGTTTFTGISTIIGFSPLDSISTSITGDANWSITSANAGTLSDDSQNLLISFSNIGKLVGSNYKDIFAFATGSSIVSAEGNGGTDTADFSKLDARTITIGAATEFSFTGVEQFKADALKDFTLAASSGAIWIIDNSGGEIDGEVGNIEFVGFKNLQGSTENDTFNLITDFGGIISAGDGNDTFQIRSAITGTLLGENGADTFAFFGGGRIDGIANAGSGDLEKDVVDLRGLAGDTVNVSGTTVYGVANIERVTADSNKEFTLVASNTPNNWTIEVANGIDGTLNQLEFAGFSTLQGGAGKDIFAVKTNFTGVVNGNGGADDFEIDAAFTGTLDGGADADTFTIDAAITGNIFGGSGSDSFIFTNAGSVAPTLGNMADGGGEADVVNLSGITTDKTIILDGSEIYGLAGIERVIGNSDRNFTLDARATTSTLDWIIDNVGGRVAGIAFVDFTTLLGGSGSDKFTFNTNFTGTVDGLGGDDTFTFNSIFTGTAQGAGGNDTFFINNAITGILRGGNDADRFVFSAAGSIANGGSANAGDGADIVDLRAIAADTEVVLTGGNTLYGVSGVERILGNGSGTSTFTLSATLPGTTDWEIYDFDGDGGDLSDGVNDGRVAGIDFVDFNELRGGGGIDKFDLQADFAGIIDAGGGDDEFNIRTAITGTLLGGNGRDTYVFFERGSLASTGNSDAGADGSRDRANFSNLVDGSVVTVSGASVMNIGGIEQVVGSTTKQFTLQAGGAGTNIWRITDENDGVVNDIQFIDFKKLLGGSGSDSFAFEGTTSSVVSIDGGSGINTLQGRNELNIWRVSAENEGTVSVNGAPSPYVVFSQIQDLTGGALADEFQIDASIRDVKGGDGNDRFIFSRDDNNGTANSINGEGGDDELFGRQTDNTWSTTGANAGTLRVTDGQLYVTSFSDVERWIGGVGADVFTLNHEISNGISARDGDNRFNVNTGVGDLEGGAGNDEFVFGDAGRARSVNGGGGTENSLTGRNEDNTWTIFSANAGRIASTPNNDYVDSFSNIQILNGGTDVDTFNINASVGRIFGHAGEDTFSFAANNNGIAALIDGGADSDTLRGRTQDSTWTMTAANAGYVATANTTYVAAFNAIETLSGAANTDTLAAINQANNWAIDGENRGSLRAAVTGAAALAFVGMENLLGNQGVDTFTFAANGNVTGLIDGGTTASKDTNSDIVNLSLKTDGVTVQLGRELSGALNIVNVEGIIAAEDVNNNLIGASDTDYQWRITADDQGVVETLLDPLLETSTKFTHFNNVTGGIKNDYFKVVSGRITGQIDGGGGDGTDFIDYSARAGHFDIELGGNTGIGGNTATRVLGIEGIRGNSASGLGTSTIKVNGGDNDWQIGSAIGSAADGINDGSFTPFGGSKVTFEDFTNLNSGSGRDTFTYLANGQWIGTIDGGSGGNNTIDASASTHAQQFHIGGNQPNVTNLSNIGELKGNKVTNSLLVSALLGNTWSVDSEGKGQLNDTLSFSGIANLRGGDFQDIFDIDYTAVFTGIIDGGGSTEDRLNLIGVDEDVSVALGANSTANLRAVNIETINANSARNNTFIADSSKDNDWVISGRNSGTLEDSTVNGTVTFSGFSNLVGGEKNDKFIFDSSSSDVTGRIDAGDGFDILDLTASNRDLVVRIAAGNTLGSNGEITVNNFETITADADKNNKLIAKNTNNTWAITSIDGGKLSEVDSGAATDFANFKHITGGDLDDTFNFASIGAITGLVDGGGHQEGDAVDVSESANANIIITAVGANSGYRNIEKYVGNNVTSTITGDNLANNWIVNNNSGTINNPGTTNSTIAFEQFVNLIGGSAKDTFRLNNATLSGYIDGAGGGDEFNLAGSTVAGDIRGGDGNNIFNITIVDGFAGAANIIGGLDVNQISVSGGNSNYRVTHSQGVLEYANTENITFTINYSQVGEIWDRVVADSLTISGTSSNDIFRLQNNKYWIDPAVTMNYQQKQDLVIQGTSGDQIIVDGNVTIPRAIKINNASVVGENSGKLTAQSLELVATQSIGSDANRLRLAVDDIYLRSTNGNIYIDEQDALNIKEFSTSATNVFDVMIGGDLLSASNINYAGQFNVNSLRGNILLNNANSLTGNLTLKAASDVAIKNTASINFAEVAAQNLTVEADGVVTGLGPMIVNGLTSISANANISLLHADNDLNVLKIPKALNVSVKDKNNLTLAGVSASGDVTINTNGAINIGASCIDNCIENFGVRAENLNINAGVGAITVGKNIAVNESVSLQAIGVTVNDAISAKQIVLKAGTGNLLLNESGHLNGQEGNLIDLAGSKVEQRSNITGGVDINIFASDDIQMLSGAVTESVSGNVTYSGRNIALTNITALSGTVETRAEGAISDNNFDDINIYANRWVADAVAGIGSGRLSSAEQEAIETDVNILSVRNAGTSSRDAEINILNSDALVIEQLRNNGDISIANLTGDLILDNTYNDPFDINDTDATTQGGVINAGTSGGILTLSIPNGMVRAENKAVKSNPDIIADVGIFEYPANTKFGFGDASRKIVMHIPSVYKQTARTSAVIWYIKKPLDIVDSSTPIKNPMSNDQLIQIEGLSEIDPAIFTSVSNYIHDEVAILMPVDQRFDEDEYAE